VPRKQRASQQSADDPAFEADIDGGITRLREMLALMAPECGSSALGATIPYLRRRQARSGPLLLPSPDAANF
jgi:hypothetical protein